jgi:membrane associated rhomboid family serine protease
VIPLRDDRRGHAVPLVTGALIVISVLVFLWQLSLGRDELRQVIYGYGLIPAVLFRGVGVSPDIVLSPRALMILTSMFLHADLLHLGGNVLYLWIFGNNVENAMGSFRFTLFYLLCGAIGALGYGLLDPRSTVPMIGASGAIAGVLGAYLLLYPYARVLIFLPFGISSRIIRLPAFWVLWFWFIFQLMSFTLSEGQEGGVAWIAHIGGFLAGMALIPIFKHRDVPLFQPPHGSRRWYHKLDR